jgi:hypothetical protein
MRPARVAIALILAALGAIWFGQGIGLLPGGFMAGSLVWAVIGGGLVALGVALLVVERRRSP